MGALHDQPGIGHNNPPEAIDYLAVGAPMPRSVGRCADLYSDVRALRLAMEKEVKTIQARETEIKDHIINNLSKSDDTGAAGLKYRAQVVVKDVVRVATDQWGVLHSWIRKNDRFDMLQKRLNETAVDDWMEQNEGRLLPGTELVKVPQVSITKI
jgi:hypothetical protein